MADTQEELVIRLEKVINSGNTGSSTVAGFT